jgi:hypothetical protein
VVSRLIEESMEIAGASVFVFALLKYIEQANINVSVRLGDAEHTAPQ